MHIKDLCRSFAIVLALGVWAIGTPLWAQKSHAKKAGKGRPTAAEAAQFVADAEKRLAALALKSNNAAWIQSTYITFDTENLAAATGEEATAAATELATASHRFDGLQVPYDVRRKLLLLQGGITVPAPSDKTERTELTKTTVSMEGDYGKGKYCPPAENGKCYDLGELSNILATSQDPAALQKAWLGWHTISPPYRARYARFVELSNKGARELGYKDVGRFVAFRL